MRQTQGRQTQDTRPLNGSFAYTGWMAPADPQAVVRDPGMNVAEKRALLASWASDAHAVPDHPALRRLEDGRILEIDDILDALKQLDTLPAAGIEPGVELYRRGHWSRLSRLWRRDNDDDDDDPLTPAPAAPWPVPMTPQLGELAAA